MVEVLFLRDPWLGPTHWWRHSRENICRLPSVLIMYALYPHALFCPHAPPASASPSPSLLYPLCSRYYLHRSWLALVVSFEPAHELHTCKKKRALVYPRVYRVLWETAECAMTTERVRNVPGAWFYSSFTCCLCFFGWVKGFLVGLTWNSPFRFCQACPPLVGVAQATLLGSMLTCLCTCLNTVWSISP